MSYLYDEGRADYYDLLFPGQTGDIRFYVEEAQKAGSPVLELGCGTGRVLIPIAEAGVAIIGLDYSPHMLAELYGKLEKLEPIVRQRIELVQGDMCDFALGKEFRLITIPCRGFLHVLTVEDQRRSLACIHEHLAEDGRLIVNFFDPGLGILAANVRESKPEMRKLRETMDPATGHKVVFYERCMAYPERQLLEEESVFEELDAEGRVLRRAEDSLTYRWTYRYEMQHLMELCGFEVGALYGDFERGQFRYGGEQIWVASKRR